MPSDEPESVVTRCFSAPLGNVGNRRNTWYAVPSEARNSDSTNCAFTGATLRTATTPASHRARLAALRLPHASEIPFMSPRVNGQSSAPPRATGTHSILSIDVTLYGHVSLDDREPPDRTSLTSLAR